MHIAVSWDISAKEPRWGVLNDQMRDCFKGLSWVRPLSTFYIVRVDGESGRGRIQERLLSVATAVPETIHFVVSPLMPGGRYNGYLPKDTWSKVNERTD